MIEEPRNELLVDTARAIHTLFFATEAAAERYRALREQLLTDDELSAYQGLSVGLINFDPLPEEKLEALRTFVEARIAESEPSSNPRITLTTRVNDPDFEYAKRLLNNMYSRWEGTLEYEAGIHRFCFFSQADEKCRRHSVFVHVSVDGESSDLRCRSYVLGPYLCVDDFRTGRKSDDPWRVLHGDLTLILPEPETGVSG